MTLVEFPNIQYKMSYKGCTKVMNYFRTQNINYPRYIVDSPGYGYLGMKGKSGDKLKRMISKYARESSRYPTLIETL